MHRCLMNMLCACEINVWMRSASHLARIFVINFAKECIKLIGLKSFSYSTVSVWGLG
jgi:hypothetical protein